MEVFPTNNNGEVESITFKEPIENISEAEKLPFMESSGMELLTQETSISTDSASEHVYCDISQQNISRTDFQSGQSHDGDGAIDIYESYNSTISSDLATERIYHNIMKQRNLLTNNIQPAKLPDESKLTDCHGTQHFGYLGTSISSGDFSATECVHQDDETIKQYLFERNNQQAKGPNGDIGSQKSGYFSQDSTIDEDVGGIEQDFPTINLQKLLQDRMPTSEGGKKSLGEKEKQHSDQDSSSPIDRAYKCIMNRYGGFRHFNTAQFSGNMFGGRDVSYAWDKEDDTSSLLTKSDSIRNLLEAMHSIGVSLDIPEDQPPDTSAPDNSTTNEHLSRDISEMNVNAKFRDQTSANFQSNPDNSAMTTSEDTKKVNIEMMHHSIQKLLLHDLQTTGCLNEESSKALNTTVDEFSQWINTLVTENEKLRKSMEEEQSDYSTKNQESSLSSPQSVPDSLMTAMINSDVTKKENQEDSGMMNKEIEKLLLHDLQTSGYINENSSKALNSTINEFSECIDEITTENKKLKKLFGSGFQSTKDSENSHFGNDIIKIRDATEREICEILENVPNSASNQESFNCDDYECKTMVVGHFLTSSNLKTLIIRKKADHGQDKYLLLEINPNVTIKTTYKTNEFNGNPLFTMHLMTPHYSFSVSL